MTPFKVRCINTGGWKFLTEDKEYLVEEVHGEFIVQIYVFKDDSGLLQGYSADRFLKLDSDT